MPAGKVHGVSLPTLPPPAVETQLLAPDLQAEMDAAEAERGARLRGVYGRNW